MKHAMHGKSSSKMSYGKLPTMRGEAERMKKVPTVKSAAGLMSHNVTVKKGKGEF